MTLLLSVMFFVFISPGNIQQYKPPTNAEMVAMGTPSSDSDNKQLIEIIKKDLKIENADVKLLLGPYENIFGPARSLNNLPHDYFILIDNDFYQMLSPSEKNALMGHEMGHILYAPKVHVYDLDRTGLEICADFFAIKYAGVDAVLSLLEKLYSIPQDDRDQPDYKIRKAALEEFKRN